MPELPEVETVKRGLENLTGKIFRQIFRSDKNLRINSHLDLQLLRDAKIKEFSRRARYLIIHFYGDLSLIVHLGMSGRITLKETFDKQKHDHFAAKIDDGTWLIFNDPRRFGFVDLLKTKDLDRHKMLSKLGPEPLSNDFDFADFAPKLAKKTKDIKTTIMENEIVVGVGNIYASESLFDCGILPTRQAKSLNKAEINKLISSIKKTLKAAIDAGGSSISDYVDSHGNVGNFQNNFRVYERSGEKCLQCKNPIQRIVLAGRASFFCNKCQK
jgi:formamidopyrimidine-DNA glycosylase